MPSQTRRVSRSAVDPSPAPSTSSADASLDYGATYADLGVQTSSSTDTPTLDQAAQSFPDSEPDVDWTVDPGGLSSGSRASARSTSRSRAPARASSGSFDLGRGAIAQETNEWDAEPGVKVTAGRSKLAARLGYEAEDSSEGATFSPGLDVQVDPKGGRIGGSLVRKSGDSGDGGDWNFGGTLGTDRVEGGWSDSRKMDSGGTLKRSATASVGQDGVRLRGAATRKGKKMDLASLDGKEGSLDAHRAAGAGHTGRLSASGSIDGTGDLSAERPVDLGGGRWGVAYSYELGVAGLGSGTLDWEGLDLGDSDKSPGGIQGARGSGEGGSVGMSGKLGAKGKAGGMRVFEGPDAEQEAMRFYKVPTPDFMAYTPLTSGGALDLAQGEKRSMSLTVEGSLGVSGEATGGPSISAGVSGSGSAGLSVTRKDDRWFAVSREVSGQAAVSGGLGAPGLDLHGQASLGGHASAVWELDLGTEEGQAAYDVLLRGGTPEPGPGVRAPTEITSSTDAQGVGVGVPGYDVYVGQQRTDEEISRPDGSRKVVEDGRQVQSVTPWRFLQGVLPSAKTDRGAYGMSEYAPDGSERDSQVVLSRHASSNSARQNRQDLRWGHTLERAGNRHDMGESTPGEWELVSQFGPGSLRRLAEAAKRPRWDPDSPLIEVPARRFIQNVRDAGTNEEALRQAVQDFGSQECAARTLKAMLGSSPESYLSLTGSETWIGAEGHAEVERVLDGVKGQLDKKEGVGPGRVSELREQYTTHSARLDDLRDYGKYPDVPEPVRDEEIRRTEQVLLRIEGLMTRMEQPMHGVEDPELKHLLDSIESRREAMEQAYEALRAEERVHNADLPDDHPGAYQDLGASDWWFWGGSEADTYGAAKELRGQAEEARREAAKARKEAEMDLEGGDIERAMVSHSTELAHLLRARTLFERAAAEYRSIQAAHPDRSWK